MTPYARFVARFTIAYTFLWQACTARVGICALICVPPQTTHAGIDQDALAPAFNNQARLVDTNEQLRAAIDAFIDKTYAVLSSPNLIAMLRLLIAESGRVPQLIQRWRDEVVLPHIAAQQQIVDQCVERGIMRRSPLTQHFEIVVAPAPYHALWQITFGADSSHEELKRMRETHRALLLELLENP